MLIAYGANNAIALQNSGIAGRFVLNLAGQTSPAEGT